MINSFRNFLSFGLCASALVFSGCVGDDSGDTDATATATTTATATATSTATSTAGTDTDVGTDSDAGTDSDTGTDTAGGAGFCIQGCAEAADCCPAGSVDCPGDYPQNWECTDGVCVFPGCSTDEECSFGGALPNNECHKIGDIGSCFEPCEDDAACEAMVPGFTCIGESDDGAKFCTMETEPPAGCTSDDECGGFGVCNADSGVCECTGDAECATDGYVCKL